LQVTDDVVPITTTLSFLHSQNRRPVNQEAEAESDDCSDDY